MGLLVVGIDPDLNGGITITLDGEYQSVIDMPTLEVMVGKKPKRIIDANAVYDYLLRELILNQHGHRVRVYMEKQWAQQPRFKDAKKCPTCKTVKNVAGITSTFNTGRNYGVLLGILVGLGLRYILVASMTWKKEVCRGSNAKGKQMGVVSCQQIFPQLPLLKTSRCRKPSEGRADSACIAHYGHEDVIGRRMAKKIERDKLARQAKAAAKAATKTRKIK